MFQPSQRIKRMDLYNTKKPAGGKNSLVKSNKEDIDNPLIRDCFELQQQLIETEKSLQKLNIASPKSPSDSLRIYSKKQQTSPQSEKAPILTLADLTPAPSETGSMNESLTLLRSGHLCHMYSSLQDDRAKEKRRKQIKQINALISENEQLKNSENIGTISKLEEQIYHKSYAISELETAVDELRDHVKEIREEEEEKRKRFEEELSQSMQTINELSERCAFLQHSCEMQSQKNSDLEELNEELKKELGNVMKHNTAIKEDHNKTKTDCIKLQDQTAELKANLLELQDKSSKLEALSVENIDLKAIVEEQAKKVSDYEGEVEKTREHMMRLEILIQKIQENKLNPRLDDGIFTASNIDYKSKHDSLDDAASSCIIIADLKSQLAVKDAELQKLQALMASRTLSMHKLKNDYVSEGSNIQSLRSELCSVKKCAELEQNITRLETELSGKTSQIVELEEHVLKKQSLILTLETKLLQKNNQMTMLKQEVKNKTEEDGKTIKELNQSVSQLNSELARRTSSLHEKEEKLKEVYLLNEVYSGKLTQLELALQAHNEETKATDFLVDKIKSLHAEHCRELEHNIGKLEQHIEEKAVQIVKLENKLKDISKDNQMKGLSVDDMRTYVKKLEELLAEKKKVIENHEKKLQILENKLRVETSHVEDLKNSLKECRDELSKTMKHLNQGHEITETKISQVKDLEQRMQQLRGDLELKNKFIEDLEQSYNQSLEMLEQSQKRITELEETQNEYEEELSSFKQSTAQEKSESGTEVLKLTQSLAEANKQIKLYQQQISEMNNGLGEAKTKFIELGDSLKMKDEKLLEQSDIILEKIITIDTLNKLNSKVEKDLKEHREEIEAMKAQAIEREQNLADCWENENKLKSQLLLAKDDAETYFKKLTNVEKQVEYLIKESNGKDENISKVEGMLAISQDEVNIKEVELKERSIQVDELEALVNEQQLLLKQKSAQFTQTEMSFKNDKSELEKRIIQLESEVSELKHSLSQRNVQFQELSSQYNVLKTSLNEKNSICEEYERKFKIQKEGNQSTSLQVQSLKQELQSFQTKVRHQIEMEDEILGLRNQLEKTIKDFQSVETQLMTSQQTVLDLTKELDELHSMLSLKEADCTRLVRELGVGQVREAQEKARLNQELRKVVQEKEFRFSQKYEEVEMMRSRQEDIVTLHQQEIMKLKLTLQCVNDKNQLCKHDLERSNVRVRELEEDVTCLTKQLQLEQQKSKELADAVVICEAKAARYSARLSSYERASLSNRIHSDYSKLKLSDGHSSWKTPESSPNASLATTSVVSSPVSLTERSNHSSLVGTHNEQSSSFNQINNELRHSRNIEESFDNLIQRANDELDILNMSKRRAKPFESSPDGKMESSWRSFNSPR
ncbi:coiled-coil domain-containing protein 18-like isoform X2 [Hydractinia symbiolongicarpus]|uniref:coiled-coil domain-containing protein 18-like isoform X2 n=1 Tax=Hydractinia symbiolongicarpus TaxID=13093 RepID=UPI00254C3D6D|nr:coiled-coil domain-containing protein 18-like isoform X2 [Hydractinia symbiolongicarpus]